MKTLTEKDIMHEAGGYWVAKEKTGYAVYKHGATHSTLDSGVIYELSPDGLSIAIARCNYLARSK